MGNRLLLPLLLSLLLPRLLAAREAIPADSIPPLMRYEGSVDVWGSTGRLAPYFIMSNRAGRFTQGDGTMIDLKVERELRRGKRFEYGFGAEVMTGSQSRVDYLRFDAAGKEMGVSAQGPSALWLQQLWGGVKFRGVFLTAGMWENKRSLFNSKVGSGDIVLGGNARPIPRVAAGFIDFQDIPFTNGWVQIEGEISWGKPVDNKWLENHFNYYDSFLTTGIYMHYSRCYFRTNPHQPLSVTVGMQNAAQFGGISAWYHDGVITSSVKTPVKFKDFVNALFPWAGSSSTLDGDKSYYGGNHLGSWDLRVRYRLHSGHELTAYMQSPWEDGSGIGKLNGFDGVWGVEYRSPARRPALAEAVLEYIDFTNQSGPIHWAPGDFPGTQVTSQATGADDYYNNYMYNGWAYYGLALGTPFIKSPIYNTDGYMRFTDNRVRGFHAGARGWLGEYVDWRMLFSFRTSWGTSPLPATERASCTSMLMEAGWDIPVAKGLRVAGSIVWDAGKLLGNNFGAFFSCSYTGALSK